MPVLQAHGFCEKNLSPIGNKYTALLAQTGLKNTLVVWKMNFLNGKGR